MNSPSGSLGQVSSKPRACIHSSQRVTSSCPPIPQPARRLVSLAQGHVCQAQPSKQQTHQMDFLTDRRQAIAMLSAGLLASLTSPPKAQAFAQPPPGFRALVDKLDGYSFFYPERWLAVTITGNDCFFRNPTNIDENLFVDISSPSSSQYQSVTDLGTPEQTAKQILEQYLNKEFMSTRIGIKREGQILSASSREGADGRTYFDVAIRMTSYASRNPYVATQGEVMSEYGLEWDRVLLTTLGVANNRLYELRLQTAQSTLDKSLPLLTEISKSFALKTVEV